jgi:predicted Zn finger-like uncharacterized protein
MILTCPECATSYFVDDARIPPAGRKVKCSNCATRWVATPEAPPEPEESEPLAADLAAEPEAVVAEAPEDDLEIVAADTAPARRRPVPRRGAPRKEAAGKVFVWIGTAAAVAVLIAGAIVFRAEVVRLWPKSGAAYAGLGLPVNSLGLVIEGVRAEPTFQGGRPVLSVTGAIRNVRDEAADAPPIRISLLNRAGKLVAGKLARPLDPRIPAGGKRHFAIAIVDPPSSLHDLQVTFEPSASKAAAPRAAEAVFTTEPVEAQPLPPGTPESLSEHG